MHAVAVHGPPMGMEHVLAIDSENNFPVFAMGISTLPRNGFIIKGLSNEMDCRKGHRGCRTQSIGRWT